MKQFLLMVLAISLSTTFAVNSVAQQKNKTSLGTGYDPQTVYKGEYKWNLLLFRLSKDDFWRRQPRMERLRHVTCEDALKHLNAEGRWQGNLKSDGSCGNYTVDVKELPEWATGNRINYDQLIDQSVAK
ncbi:MAG TPA: hypothetical protein VK654_03150 [Nitrospirota bacterium]|nr:hypothetical protein [Nitrospirota bacterium]